MNAKHVFHTLLIRRSPRKLLVGSTRIALGRVFVAALLLALTVPLALPARPAHAQSPDDGFNPGANDLVWALAVQSDGKIVVGGDFTTLGGQTRNRIGRLNADGTLDTTFNPGANNAVYALAVQSDGKIVVGGNFTTLGGQTRNYIGRLKADGTLDATFNPNANNDVYALAVQSDGKIVVGGPFTTLGGQTRNRIGRLNADGTLDTTFNPDAAGSVGALAVQSDGKLVVGGAFTTLGGQTRNRIGRLNADGTLDTTFNPGADYAVFALAVQPDGKLVVGGRFATLGGQMRNRIGRLSSDAAALQNLTANTSGTTVTWTRSGAGPEVWRVTFASSTDGATYAALGAGTRIAGGWQLTGLTLPRGRNLFIRARGYYATGYLNGSASVVESVRNVYLTEHTIYLPLVLRQ